FSDCGCSTGMPRDTASIFTGEAASPRPRPAGRSGWVYTATTSWWRAAARSDDTANSGVPAKTILMATPMQLNVQTKTAPSTGAAGPARLARALDHANGSGRRQAGSGNVPALLGQLLAHHLALERREVIDEQLAVQVVHL